MSLSQAFDVAHWMRPGTLQLQGLPPLSLYVHLPWCLKKCPYCDFNSHAWADPQALPAEDYVQALMLDLEASLGLVWGRPVHSVFFGGGTPSLFHPEAIASLVSGLRARLPLVPDCEITLEANPGSFERDRFRGFREAGINRLSVGVQSFQPEQLQRLGRVHTADQALAALEEAAEVFDRWNLDLMYALPQQTMAQLQDELAQVARLQAPHVSIYQLTLEPNTVFAKFPPEGLPDEDLAYDMLDEIMRASQAMGLSRYEVSAFAGPGQVCRHNLNYWQFGDYLGIGAGAHSKLSFAHRVVRQVRHRDPMRYMVSAREGQAVAQVDEVGRQALPFEFMLNALRLAEGFSLAWFAERTGLPASALEPGLSQAIEADWLTLEEGWLRPTPKGLDFLSNVQQLFL